MTAAHPILTFEAALDSLTSEHRELKQQFDDIKAFTRAIPFDAKLGEILLPLQALKEQILEFMTLLGEHMAEEQRAIFPVLRTYTDIQAAELAEQEMDLANVYIQAFADYLKPWEQAEPSEMLSFLNQAYHLLEEQMRSEEKLILTPADKIMEQLDYMAL